MSCIIKDGKYYDNNGNESKLYQDLVEKVGEQEAHNLFVLSHTPTFKSQARFRVSNGFQIRTNEEESKISIGENYVIVTESYPEYEFLDDITEKQAEKLGINEGDFISKIEHLESKDKGKGFGRKLMQEALELIKSQNMFPVYLNASPIGRDGLPLDKLTNFYKSFGFKVFKKQGGNNLMILNKEDLKLPERAEQEPSAKEVLKYAEDNFSLAEPLTQEEILDLSTLQLDVETSEELYDLLYDAFYVDSLFSPQKNLKKLKQIYTETEIRNILQDITIQARIKETIEKLRFTEPFNITQIDKTNPYYYKELIINTIGQYKSNVSEPKEGVEIDVIDENNTPVENKLFYTNAIKEVKNPKIFQAIDAIIAAPKNLTEEIQKVQKKVEGWLLDHGMNIKNLPIENYPILKNYLREVKEEDAIELEKTLGFERSPKKETVKIDTPTNRTYKYLRTVKTEQELFDQYSLIKTNTPNVYHQIEKIEEQEIRDIQDNQDLTVPVYELYKDYYGYGISQELKKIKQKSINDGTFMKAPNGKKSNLSEDNWLLTRTESFKNWFGDWINDPQNSSKVVDENGEPMLVYHNTNADFTEFDKSKVGTGSDNPGASNYTGSIVKEGFYFSNYPIDEYGFKEITSFLNIRNPFSSKEDNTQNKDERQIIIEENNYDGYYFYFEDFDQDVGEYITFNPNQIKSAEKIQLEIDQESNDIRYLKRQTQKINTNIETDINEDYVADFAIEKLKKPNEFNELFKITENGIELINDDKLTIAKIKSQLIYYPKMADYAKISKILSNYDLVPAEKTIETKEFRRIQAVNNKQSIPSPKTEIEIIDDQFIKAPNEIVEFLKIGNNIFEQQEAVIYSKLEFKENPNYFTLKVEAPPYRTFENKIEKPTEVKPKKLIDKETNDENFNCL